MVIIDLLRLADIHHTLYRKTFAKVVLVAQVAAVQLEASVIVLCSKTGVEISEHLNNRFAFRLLGCGILRLCADTDAG